MVRAARLDGLLTEEEEVVVVEVEGEAVAVEVAAVTEVEALEAADTEDLAAVHAAIFAGVRGAREIPTKIAAVADVTYLARRRLSPQDSTGRSKRRVSCPKFTCKLPPAIPWCIASGSIE